MTVHFAIIASMSDDVETLSIVVPCHNDVPCIGPFVAAIDALALPVAVEIVFVDDGSTDGTVDALRDLVKRRSDVRHISFSRNFGKDAAMLAGMRAARGNYVVTMDVDLQDPPTLLPQMLEAVRSGRCESVATRRVGRAGEPPIRAFFARLFYRMMRCFSEIELVDGARDYRLMSRHFCDAVISLPEVNRFTRGIYQWVGFKTEWLEFKHVPRIAGETSWSFFRLVRYAFDNLIAFSTFPLKLASCIGIASCFCSFAALLFVIVRKLVLGDPVAGWPSLVCIIVFIGGIQLFVAGILGAYLAKTYSETKRRPPYLISETSDAMKTSASATSAATGS